LKYSVLLHPKAAKELQSLDEPVRSRVRERLKELNNDPESIGKRLKQSEFWSLRVGDYRAIYEILEKKRQVTILFIGHRKNVYDDFSKIF